MSRSATVRFNLTDGITRILAHRTATSAVASTTGTFPPPSRYPADGGLTHMPIARNWLFLIKLAVSDHWHADVAALGFKVYQDHKEPKGVQRNFGPSGISVQKK